ncbi:hypothetical protein N7520_010116 [Penicillium odoratum]|uniref:uncharacterized protein n=1 Tax=Penicillium odoratum TaxID=1167516 RepID=UPI002548BC09|nr:uncharacterized protein N7520_010116 [Penicillium odoratum]KAJ5753199.1 hypothetical protein N7520_010116 [Penicillium odoratum]
MNRLFDKLSRRDSPNSSAAPASPSDNETTHDEGSPEALIQTELVRFCEKESGNDEFVHLPRIVELAESSPAAAKEAAYRIRKFLKTPTRIPNNVQYQAIMVMRILTDNPGATFTRNFDTKFVKTIEELLRYGRDYHVQSYLRSYLKGLESTHHDDPYLQGLLQMWAKEQTSKGSRSFMDHFRQPNQPNPGFNAQMAPPPPPRLTDPVTACPDAGELAARVAEARNSAKLLTQFVQMTPPAEINENELIKEFTDRCRTSSRLIQSYIHANNPAPDEDTLLTLIECNDEVSVALSNQQRAMLRARKAQGSASPSGNDSVSPVMASGARQVPESNPSQEARTGALIDLDNPVTDSRINPVRDTQDYEYRAEDFQVDNPFADNNIANDSNVERNPHSVDSLEDTLDPSVL